MLYWTIKITIISIILIFLVHHLISFFTSTLTVPKIKDIFTSSSQKYELIYNIISKPDTPLHDANPPHNMYNKTTSIDLLPNASSDDNMKLELKNFIKNQMNQSDMGTTNIADINYNIPM
jgi:hypothetical protein